MLSTVLLTGCVVSATLEQVVQPAMRGRRAILWLDCYSKRYENESEYVMPPKTARSRVSATERVEQHIRQCIYSGVLRPRERLIEEDLAKQLNCSRGPVREALLRLERDGLIVTVPRRGTFIHDISTESIEVIFSMRGKLEALCVRYLRQELTEQAEQTLRKALKVMKNAATAGDEEEFLQADLALHRTIWKLSNRDQLYRTLNTIMNPLIFMVARAFSARAPIKQRYRNHEAYVETILTTPLKDVEAAVEDYFRRLYEKLGIEIHPGLLLPNSVAKASSAVELEA